ncbi:MAG TPA: tetratricopeptide repeat protein [Candidatus Melainabacteria bacterium]|nr:tetratricopeptide repeat protein [Candidatus Melainabacteria bacterium]
MTSLVKKTNRNRAEAESALLFAVLLFACTVLSSVSPLPTCALTQAEDNEMRSHINAGNHYLARRLYDEAINEYEAALKIDPECRIAKDNIALVHNNKGTDYFSRRLYQEAQKEWQTALSLNPNDAIARRNLQVLAVHMRHQREKQLRLQEQTAEDAEEAEAEEEKPVREPEATRKKEIQEKKEEPPKPAVILSAGSNQVKMSDDGKVISPQNSEDAFSENSEENTTAPSVDSVINDSLSTLNALKENKTTTTQMKVVPVPEPVPAAAPEPEKSPKTVTPEIKPAPVKEEKEEENQKLTISRQLSRLEKEVFGEERRDDPILKRLLHLEKDTLGKKQSGTVKERLKRLNETYGFKTDRTY